MSESTALEQYLLSLGWTSGDPADLREWFSEDGDVVVVPHKQEYADYRRVMSHTKSELESILGVSRTFLDSVTQLASSDVIDVHAFPTLRRPAYAFDAILELLESTRASFTLAARSLTKPAILYGGGSVGKDATEYLKDLRIGFSQPGSYSFPVFAPLGLEKLKSRTEEMDGQNAIPEAAAVETYERRVTLRMLDSVRETTVLAEEASESGLSVFDEAYVNGVSSNLCEAIDGMFVDGYFSAVEIRPRLAVEITSQPRSIIRVEASRAPVLKEAASHLRELSKRVEPTTVTGRVTDLHRSTPGTDESVSVTTLLGGKRRVVQMELDPAQYQQAIRAHDTTSTVIARGELSKRGTRSWLENVSSFAIVDDATLPGTNT